MIKYSNYNNVFFVKNAIKLLENTRINKHAIKLEESKHPLLGLIYSLEPIKLEILKTHIKINLVNGFIWLSKSPTKTFILFDQKPDKSLYLYVNNCGLNNTIIKT